MHSSAAFILLIDDAMFVISQVPQVNGKVTFLMTKHKALP